MPGDGWGGGVGTFRLLRRGFEFLVRMEPAHIFTFFFFLLGFRSLRFGGAAGSAVALAGVVGVSSTQDVVELAVFGDVSTEQALVGRDRVGELVPRNGSRLPRKDHFLGVLDGLGVEGLLRLGSGIDGRSGMEFRLLGEAPTGASTLLLWVRSSTAPAVLGLDSGLDREGLRTRGEAGSLSAMVELTMEMIDEMLPETE